MAENIESLDQASQGVDFNNLQNDIAAITKQPAQPSPILDLSTSKFNPMPLSSATRDIGGGPFAGPNNNITAQSVADYISNSDYSKDLKAPGAVNIYGANEYGRRFAKFYNHSAFDRVGFSPYINNNQNYLQYATGWEDFKTAIAPNRLFTAGMIDQATNWFEWGKPTDPYAARRMTSTMELYQTERDGFWGGAANTMASLQYSMGAITEFALEEGALIGLTAATGSAAGEAGLLRTIRNVGALGRTLSVGAELLNTIRTVDRAKDFWQAARFAGVGAAKTANALVNPLYRTTSNAYDTYKALKAGKTTAEIAKNKAYFGDFFRDLSEINMALSEGRLEGGIAQNDIYQGILKSNPNITSDEIENAYKLAVKGGSETTLWNTMTIYMTNKFVFDSLLGRMLPKSSRLLKMGESLGGKYVMDQGKHVFLENGLGKNFRRAILPFSREGKLYYKHLLQTAPNRLASFALGSSMEGLQENVQEALNIGYTDYYTKLYNTPDLAQSQGLRASISKGINEQFTTQGLQTFLSGFAIGGGLGVYGKALNWSLYQAPMIVADKTGINKGYSTAKEARAKFRDEVNSVVADMDADPISYFNAIENDLAHQVNFYDYVFAAQNAGDNKQVKTNQDAQLLKRIHTLFRSGQVDLLRDTFREYRNMSDQDLQEAFQGYKLEGDENNKPLRDRLDETLNKIDVMEKSFKEAQKIENPYNPFKFDKTKEPDKYNEEAYKYLAVEEVKFDMAFLKTTLVLAQQYTADILEKAGKNKPLANMPGVQFTSIITKNGLKAEIDMLRKERIAYEQTAATSDKAKAELGRIDKKLDLYEKFLSGYELYQDAKRNAPADIIRNKSQKKQDGETEQTINPVTESIENHADNLKNAFFDVIKELASETGDNPLSENIDDLFESLREMIDHDVDFSSSIDALNMLYDPAGFEAHHGRIKQALENVHKMHKENNTKIFDELQHKKDLNAFLNNLMAKGIFYDPKYAAAFEDDSVLPESFIDATTMEELDHTSPKYKDLLNEIDNFERSTGKTLSGKLIPEFDPLSISTRVQRAPGDVRTMAVLSRQFGVSQDTTEDSVSVEEVLEALMKSPQALPTEKVLAKRLLPLISKAAKINFVRNLSQPVSYSESTGIMVDLRYASIDYSGGILKAEPIVLSGILKSIVTNALETNNNFKQKAQNLLNIAKQNILDKNNNYSQLPIGLDSVENFIAEALTNLNFQASLRNIEYTGERASKTSLWQEFKKALEDLFTKIFKLAPKTKQTLLDEAIDLTALTIDANANMVGSTPATGASTPNNNTAGVPITQDMPFEEIMAIPQYAEALRKVFAAFPQLGTDEDAFKQFVLTNPSAKGVIDNLNVQTGRTNPNAQVPGESQSGSSNNNVAPGQEVISDDDLRLFRENNTVSDDILNDIKTRREQGQDLTPRQHEIMKSPYGEIIEKAISLQIDQIDQDKQTEIQIMAEAEKLTMPDIYGPMEEYPFGADKAFNLIYGGKLHIVKDEKGNYTAILFQNLTQEQVLAGEGIKTFAVSTILQRPEPGYKPLQDLLRPLQAKIDEIVAKNTKPATQPGTPTTTSTTVENQVVDIAKRKQENDAKYAEMLTRQQKELDDLNKKEGKNYGNAFDILNINEYSEDQEPRSQEAIDLANRHDAELEQLLNEKRGIEDDAAKISYGGVDLSQKQAIVAKLKALLSDIYRADRNALEEGFMVAPSALAEAAKVGGTEYSAHGMAKVGLAGATEALIDLFTKGINPLKGRGKLDTAPLAGGVSVGTTAGGNAYMEGPFTLVANKSIQGAITSVDQIAGVIVNEGIATPEVLDTLRKLFPNIVFESTSNTSKLVEQLNGKTTTTTTTQTPTTTTTQSEIDAKADIERRKEISYSLEPGSQSSYERNKFTFTYVRPFDFNELDNIRPVGQKVYIVNNYGEQKTFDSYAEGQKWLDSKYNAEIAALAEQPATTTTTTGANIIQTNEPNIQTVGNVTFGTANKQGDPDNNEDALYVDTQNGIFILADGMGGEGMLTLSPAQASRLVINRLLGKTEKNLNELLYEEYLKNPDITNDEVLAVLQKNGINLTGASVVIPSKIVNAFRTREDLGVRKGFRSGATALKAVRTGTNTYSIEKIGDTVFFVVDKNGNVIQKHGLSDVATTQGYMFSIRDGKPYANTPKTDNFTVTLNEGETLVLSTDFIETDKAVQDFINSNFGKNLDFAKFQKENKKDDSTFITIEYDGKAATTTTATQANIETRRQAALGQPTTKTEPEKTEEQQVDDDINTNPETRDEVNEGMSGIDNATTEVENDIAEIERKANEGKTAPLTERAKETINQIKEATAKLKESMKSSYAKMGPEMTNAYEKLRRAHKQTAGKVREKLKVLLDKILKFLRKLGDIVKTSFNKVFSKRTTEGFVIQPGAPTVTVTGLETRDNTLEQVSDFISNLLNNYGFTAFFKQSGFAITPDLIKSLDTKGSKLGDSQILGYASAMETALHKLLHLYIDTKVSGKEMSRFDAKAKVRIETIKTLIGQKIAEGKPYQSTLDKLNYILDKNPAHQIAAYFMTNREFRSLVSGLSKDSYRALEILSKDMTDFTDAKVRKFITLQDGLNMADEEYDSFEKNSVPSPMTILSEAIENTGGEGTVANLANQLATPIEEIIATETTEEELQEIAKSEGKSVTEIVTDIKNAVTRYLSSTTLGRTKTSLDQAPKTKKESVIRRIIRKLRNILMAMSISFGMYTGVAGFDMSTSSTAEEDVAKPAWSIANAIDNTMYWLPISESYKQTIMRGFIKYGIYDISNVKEAVIEDVAEAQAIKESEDRLQYIRQNTYFQDFGKEGTVRDDRGRSTDSLFMYRNQWFNDVGFEYLATPSNSTRDRVGQMTYNNTVAVAHFYIMDDTGGDLSRYTSAEKLQEARDVFKKRIGTYDVKLTDYVPVFKFMPRNEQGENIVKLQYKIASELTNDDIAITKLLQWKFSDIDWDSKVGLYDASYCLTTKSGTKAPSFTFSRNPKGRDSYSRFSGSTIVFIFNDQKGNTIVREFTGPLNAIKAEAENIMQTFNVEPEDLTLGAFDAGSYSGKPKAKSNVLDTNQWDGFNKIHPNAGSALVIPIASTTKMIQLSDISAPQSEINNVINEKTKACK